MNFNSQANQDEFVFNILNKPDSGFYVDIGSQIPNVMNNTYFFETVGWDGICVDKVNYDYRGRRCKFYCEDAVEVDYRFILKQNFQTNVIDYLSIDTDENSLKCLEKIPLSEYTFKVITIEHDSYRFGNKLKDGERRILKEFGYYLLCEDVTCLPLKNDEFFEDWWVKKEFIDGKYINSLKSTKERCDLIVKKFV